MGSGSGEAGGGSAEAGSLRTADGMPVYRYVDDWLRDKLDHSNTIDMCMAAQNACDGSPWVGYAGDNFFTLALKCVTTTDSLTELIFAMREPQGSFRQLQGMFQGGAYIFFTVLQTFALISVQTGMVYGAFFQFMETQGEREGFSPWQWVGFMGCMGEAEALFVPAVAAGLFGMIAAAAFIGGFLVAVAWFLAKTCGDGAECSGEAAVAGYCRFLALTGALVVLFFGSFLFPMAWGAIVFLFSGLPAVFPMIGLLIVVLFFALLLQLVVLIPDLVRFYSKGEMDDEAHTNIGSKLGFTFVITVAITVMRSPIIFGMGVENAYIHYFTTVGAYPLFEEFGTRFLSAFVQVGFAQGALEFVAWIEAIKLSLYVSCLPLRAFG